MTTGRINQVTIFAGEPRGAGPAHTRCGSELVNKKGCYTRRATRERTESNLCDDAIHLPQLNSPK